MDLGFTLTSDAVARLGRVIRRDENAPRPARGGWRSGSAAPATHTACVQVTGSLVGSYYQGAILRTTGNDGARESIGNCWIWPPNGDALVTNRRYEGRLTGQYGGLPVFSVSEPGGATGSLVVIFFVTNNSTPTGRRYAGAAWNYDDASESFVTSAAGWLVFPNSEVPGLKGYGAVYTGQTYGGLPVYLALGMSLTLKATDAGTGDTNATVYGIDTVSVNQGSGLALTYPSTYGVKVAAQDASKTHSGVVNLTAQILGDGDKSFSDALTVNEDQGAGNVFTVKKSSGSTPALQAKADGTVRINTTASTYNLEVGGNAHFTTNVQIDTNLVVDLDVTVGDQLQANEINSTTGYLNNGIPGVSATFDKTVNTSVTFDGGLATNVT